MGYVLQQRLGRGGMGVVDLALDPAGQPVAIKRLVLQGSVHDMAAARQRIRREAVALTRMEHPHIVRLLDVHDDGDDVILVMPYLAGGTLADQVRAHGPLPPDRVRAMTRALLGALAAAHRQGVIHRDIKPANVLFDTNGCPYLADFGIASLRDATSGLTSTGMMIGTPEFMAPEQARGERATAASDVFSLGATLAYAATGDPPYGRGDPRVLLQRAAHGRTKSLPNSVPPDLRRLLQSMLERQPKRRPTAAALHGGTQGPEGTRVAPARTRRPRAWRGAAIGAAFGTIATAGVLVGVAATRATPLAAPATTTTAAPATTTTPCEDQPYRPCGAPAAPFTDGVSCIDDHDDYDGDAANGCEAEPDTVDGTELDRPIRANLVPGTDTDRYRFHVGDNLDMFCDGELRVTLTAPKGASMHLDLLEGTSIVDGTTSSNGRPATVTLHEDSCLHDDSADLTARVSWSGEKRTAANYTLERSGSF